ncbi:hypothetical protein AC249_AIPGENE28098 [Exaiptasia diaphana]|nr:hypothetical protein AC249_AIPGENE28098 [Exaiptasia diaphana]
MREALMMKASEEKEKAIQKLDLGCNMRMKGEDVHLTQKAQDKPLERRQLPKCEHNLMARVGINTSDQNKGRIYFSCNVKVPDLPCSFFQWFDENVMEGSQTKKTRRGRECACYGCTNTQYSKDGRPTGVSLFTFPSKNPKRDRWCNLIKRQHGRDGFTVNKLTVICEEHFKREDIYKPPGGTRCRLKSGVEPSIFPWQSSDPKPKRRVLCRQQTSSEASTITKNSTEISDTKGKAIVVEESFQEQSSSFLENNECNDAVTFEDSFDVETTQECIGIDKAVQTDLGPSDSNIYEMHSYSLSFCNMTTFGEQQEYIKRLEEKLEKQHEQINTLISYLIQFSLLFIVLYLAYSAARCVFKCFISKFQGYI